MTRTPPKPDRDLPAKRLAADRHDNVARFLHEEFSLGKEGFVLVAAPLKAYELWSHARGKSNRALSPVELLDHISTHYGLTPGVIKVTTYEGEESYVFGIADLRFKNDDTLNERLKSQLPASLVDECREAERKDYSAKKKKPLSSLTDEERKARLKWYARNDAKNREKRKNRRLPQ